MTMTSNVSFISNKSNKPRSFPDAKPREDVREQILAAALSGDLFERCACLLKIGQDELLRQRATFADYGRARARHRIVRGSNQRRVTYIADLRSIREQIHIR